MLAVAYNRVVVMCRQYDRRINASEFSDIVRLDFPRSFQKSATPSVKRFLQDSDPSQNYSMAHRFFKEVGAMIFSISPCSSDLNLIESFFHLAGMVQKNDTIKRNIEGETFEEL